MCFWRSLYIYLKDLVLSCHGEKQPTNLHTLMPVGGMIREICELRLQSSDVSFHLEACFQHFQKESREQ